MTLPNHIGAYDFELEHFDRAVEDPTGIRVHFGKDSAKAKVFQLRLHQARALDRQKARRMYPSNDPRHGASIYDPLIVKVREDISGDWWVYIERQLFDPGRIESLTEEQTDATQNLD
jgi:hypothetical protein